MKTVVLSITCWLAVICVLYAVPNEQKKDKQDKQETKEPPKVLKGKSLDKKVDALPKFGKPVDHVPDHQPPPKKGGSWHWHRHHGWLWFVVGQAPPTILVPVNFQLPPVITYYQAETPPIHIVCPNCGQPIVVYIR